MTFRNQKWVGLLVFYLPTALLLAVTPEERKAEFAKPRGLSQSSSSAPSSPQTASVSSGVKEIYSQMGENFNKQLTDMSKDFTKSLPKVEKEPNYLEELSKAQKSLDSSPGLQSKSSLLSQYTELIIATLQEMSRMQIEFEFEKSRQQTKDSKEKSPTNPKLHTTEPSQSVTPHSFLSQRAPSSSNSRGLFSKEIDSITQRAYNPPN